jgi:hypothetical protein
MGFLDDLKDKAEEFGEKAKEGFGAARNKASDLIGDVKDRLDQGDDAASADAGAPASADPSSESVDNASRGLDEAVAGSGFVTGTAGTETAADTVGDVGAAPVVDPLEPGERVADAVDAPAENAVTPPAVDPLDPAVEAVDPVVEPADAPAADEDPLEAPPDRTTRGGENPT